MNTPNVTDPASPIELWDSTCGELPLHHYDRFVQFCGERPSIDWDAEKGASCDDAATMCALWWMLLYHNADTPCTIQIFGSAERQECVMGFAKDCLYSQGELHRMVSVASRSRLRIGRSVIKRINMRAFDSNVGPADLNIFLGAGASAGDMAHCLHIVESANTNPRKLLRVW